MLSKRFAFYRMGQMQVQSPILNSFVNPINMNNEQIESWTARNEEELQLFS